MLPSCLLLQSKNAQDAVICLRTHARVHFSAPTWQRLLLLTGWERLVKCTVRRSSAAAPQFISFIHRDSCEKRPRSCCGGADGIKSVWEMKKKKGREKRRERHYWKDPLALRQTQKTGINKDEEIKRKMRARCHRSKNDHFSHQQNEINDD